MVQGVQGDRAVLVGLVNRGEGCARGDSMAIYARCLPDPANMTRVKYYMSWIKATVNKVGRCGRWKIKKPAKTRWRKKSTILV